MSLTSLALLASSRSPPNTTTTTHTSHKHHQHYDLLDYTTDSLAYLDSHLLQDENLKLQVEQEIHQEINQPTLTDADSIRSIRTPTQLLHAKLSQLNIPNLTNPTNFTHSKHPFIHSIILQLDQNNGQFNSHYQAISSEFKQKIQWQIQSMQQADWAITNALKSDGKCTRSVEEQIQISTELLRASQSKLDQLKQLGSSAFKSHNAHLTTLSSDYSISISSLQTSIDAINRKRKTDSVLVQPKLQQLEQQFQAGVGKNIEIQLAVVEYEEKIKRLKLIAEQGGIDLSEFEEAKTELME